MASNDYRVLRTLLDVTDTTINATQTKTYQATQNITPNTILTTALQSDQVAEATQIEIYSPRSASGVYEDLREIWFVADSVDLRNFIQLSGVGTSNMMPPHNRVHAHRVVTLGEPFWKLAEMGMTADFRPKTPVHNFPVKNSTIKYSKQLTLAVKSLLGVTGAGSNGWRVVVKGYVYTAKQLALLAAGYSPNVYLTDTRRLADGKPALALPDSWDVNGPVGITNWTRLLGGTQQAKQKAFPMAKFAYNGNPTQPTSPFQYSTNTQIGGAAGNVSDDYQQLGFEYKSGNKALLVRGFGVRQTGATYNVYAAGWNINGEAIPTQGAGVDGIFVSNYVNPIAFGQAAPFVDADGQFLGLAKFPGGLILYQDNATIYTRSTASDPANAIIVATNGVAFEGLEG